MSLSFTTNVSKSSRLPLRTKEDLAIRIIYRVEYQNVDKTKRDALTTLKHYRGLSPKLDKFVFNDGSERELLNLEGTIPVRYKGATYNIPVCVWLLDNHPLSSPMVYVKPTADMLIKASRHVDQSGKVYLPYLHEWNPSSSDLMGLIQIMIMTFGEMPPVYSKPKTASPAPYQTPYPTNPPGHMPMPGGTPYPPPTSTAAAYPLAGSGYTPYPPAPSQAPYPATQNTPYPLYPPPSSSAYQPPPPYPPTSSFSSSTPYPPYPVASSASTTVANSDNTTNTATTGTITEEHIRASLISAVNDRVRARLRDAYGGAQAEASVLRQQQADLNTGKAKLESLINKLEHEQAELDKSIRLMREREGDMKSVLSRLSSATDPLDVDDAVTTTAPLYKQLLNAYAEDQATQDAIYYLGEALRRDVIDLDTFLKHVRSLSRKQFQLRAIMNKCRTKANFAG
ncbi:tumor susceptibility gene 101 isoform X3 [Oratosquilla oratoria]|uniref:tumor susceptibility gene 101 isoform X3 n=1 Tax=Oratosquilla oratoria TaxID=337810 RepID=UPI003F758C5C